MRRILILLFLAIASTTFAVDSSHIVLQATKIRENSVMLSWQPIPGAIAYKVLYDEDALVDQEAPQPLLEMTEISTTTAEIKTLSSGTAYYFVVQGFDASGSEVGKSLPLHAATYAQIPFEIVGVPTLIDDQTVHIMFSRAIDISKTEIDIINTDTQKARTIESVVSDDHDLRQVIIQLNGRIAPGVVHDVVLRRVMSISGAPLPLEKLQSYTLSTDELVSQDVPPSSDAPIETEVVPSDAPVPPDTTVPPSAPAALESPVGDVETVEVVAPEAVDTKADAPASEGVKSDEMSGEVSDSDADMDEVVPEVDLSYQDVSEDTEDKKTPVPIDVLPHTGAGPFLALLLAIMLGYFLTQQLASRRIK